MAAVPMVFVCTVYPRDKSVKPYPATLVGLEYNPTLEIGGGPIEPPPDIPVEPPLTIWPNPPEGQAPLPEHPIMLPGMPGWPDTPPPDQVPPAVQPPHPGWNWSVAKGQWYYLYVPGSGQPQPKR